MPLPVRLMGGPSVRRLVSPGALGPGMTFSRASTANARPASGIGWDAYATDAPRFNGSSRRLLVEGARTNLLLNSAALATQSVAVTAQAYTLAFEGTGSVALSGASTGTLAGTGANNRVALTFTPTAGTLALTATGDVRFGQLEAGAFASAWVTTAGAAATRAVDVPTCALSAAQAQRGTLAGVFMLPQAAPASSQQGLLLLSDGTDNNRIVLRNQLGTSTVNFARVVSGTGVTSAGSAAITPGAPFKAALGWDQTGITACIQGGALIILSGAIPVFNQLRLGANQASGGDMFGEIGPLDLYPTRLPDAQLQALTA